jgi:hypothetical protein
MLEFKVLHQACPALRTILIPNLAEWEQACVDLEQDKSGHRSILLGAFERGCLHRLTLPIHKFLMAGGSPKPGLRAQYVQDLQERWFIRPDPNKRHRRSKGYLGRLSELLVAEWAESKAGLKVIGLEATGSKHDILAVSTDHKGTAIEVKFIGTEDSDFEKLLLMKIFGGARDMPTAGDFFLTRIYEAARQLANYPDRKTAIIIIDDFMAWIDFDAALTFGHIDFLNPRFQSTNAAWLEYLEKLRERYPSIDSDLGSKILSLDEIRIFRLISDETLKEEKVVGR